ncbi:DUF2075 domain-containing protein [Psychrobacter sp. GP33]|uniref:DUF2075 domain-containing protein n=1 Tax=Psychrobacter sp. GP33 TaxID=2758709 RepID=UPI001C70B3F6|nr:DUF2075 domain-containing protein [Psychrobacter sp. GP33]
MGTVKMIVDSIEFLDRNFIFDNNTSNLIKTDYPTFCRFPVIYVIYSNKSMVAYVGETTNISSRIRQHLRDAEKSKLKNIKVIFSHYFNKSAVLDIEANLIKYMGADGSYMLLNANDGITDHEFYQRQEYNNTFHEIWERFKLDNLVKHDILEIENSNLFKFSPYKALSENQHFVIHQYLELIIEGKGETIFFEGSAGTGKTIIAIYLMKLLLNDVSEDDVRESNEYSSLIPLANEAKKILFKNISEPKIGLVVPMKSLRKTLKGVFKSINGLKPNMVITASEAMKSSDYDLLLVDESHRLKRRKNIVGYGAFDKNNASLGLGQDGTELDWVMLSSRYTAFFYDPEQSVRPSDIPHEKFLAIKSHAQTLMLTSQMRVLGGNNYIDFVDKLLTGSNDLSRWESHVYELKLFRNIHDFIKNMEEKESKYKLCRTISGYSWEWLSKKEPSTPDLVIDGIEFFWNRIDEDWINSTTSITEMGCIHTTQGYDLNYAGIIFGSDIRYNNEAGRIETIATNYYDRNGKAGISPDDLHEYIIKIYKTIMYRGIKGTFIYCYDPNLRDYFSQYIPIY